VRAPVIIARAETIDTTIALEIMVLVAWSLGIGSYWIGSLKEQKLKNY